MLDRGEVLLLLKAGGKPEYHEAETGRSYYKAPCSQPPLKKEKPAPELLRTKERCHDTMGKALGWAVTGGLHQDDNLITFPAVRVVPLGEGNA